MNRSTFRIRRS